MIFRRLECEGILKRWAYYERNIEELSGIEKQQARKLFVTLKRLSKEDAEFLYLRWRVYSTPCNYDRSIEQYRTTKPIAYREFAKGIGKTVEEIRSMNYKAMRNFQAIINEVLPFEAIEGYFYMKQGNLFFIKLLSADTVVTSIYQLEAMAFTTDNQRLKPLLQKLFEMGFEPFPAD